MNKPTLQHFTKTSTNYLIYLILLMVGLLYLPILNHQFTNWDDGLYVVHNPYLKSLSFENIRTIFTTYYAGNYHPLSMLSLAIDYKTGGMKPFSYLLTNLLIHVLNTFLVYRLILQLFFLSPIEKAQKYTLALITATLFGIHTFQVETVAWVSERKNLLYTFFFLLSLLAYCQFIQKKSTKYYFLALFVFILALLSKGMAVTLSISLFCVDYFYHRNLLSKKVIAEKIPFLLLSLLFGVIAIFAQQSGDAFRTNGSYWVLERIAVASYGFVLYLVKLIYPYNLACYYPYPVNPNELLPAFYYVSVFLVLALFIILLKYFRNNRIAVFGVSFFVVNISIVLQLLPVGDAVMADRYVYLPAIGFFLVVAYSIHLLNTLLPKFKFAHILLVAYCVMLMIKTNIQTEVWANSLTLWENALNKYLVNNDRGYLNRGNIFYEKGDFTSAEKDYNQVLAIDYRNSGALIGLGLINRANNNLSEAIDYFDKALTYKKTHEGYINRAALKIDIPDYEGALEDLDRAYELNPYRTGVYNNRGVVYLNTGQYTKALDNFNKAVQLDKESYHAYLGIGRVNQALGNLSLALNALNIALSKKQTIEGYTVRADVKMMLQDISGAREDYHRAMQINPKNPQTYTNLGILELSSGNTTEAFFFYNKAITLNNKSAQAYMYRGIAKIDIGDYTNAVFDLDTSLNLNLNATALYYRGLAYKSLLLKTKACADFKQSGEMGNPQAQNEYQTNCEK